MRSRYVYRGKIHFSLDLKFGSSYISREHSSSVLSPVCVGGRIFLFYTQIELLGPLVFFHA